MLRPVREISDWYEGPETPDYSWKKFLLPAAETLLQYADTDAKTPALDEAPTVLWGVSLLDLKALTLLLQVFGRDPFIERRRDNLFIVGSSQIPAGVEYNHFEYQYEENVLEHLRFDVFIEEQRGKYRLFTGSEKGRKLLESIGETEFAPIEFAGYTKEDSPDPAQKQLRDAVEKSMGGEVWEKLGEICLACGKCTLVCPTCYCFKLKDLCSLRSEKGKRQRQWDACFFSDFTEMLQGKENQLKTAAARIAFWYYHKFVRDFDQFKVPSCVGCGRCSKTCPVGIKMPEVLEAISHKP